MRTPQRQHDERAAEDGPDPVRPIFLDQSGRRRRVAVLVGSGIGAALLLSLALIAVGLFTGAPVSVPGWPGSDAGPRTRTETGAEQLNPSPGATTRTGGVPTTAGPVRTGSPVPARSRATRGPVPSTSPSPSGTDRPGQGDLHRNTPSGKPSKPPRKPS
jgi:hypothetical protein